MEPGHFEQDQPHESIEEDEHIPECHIVDPRRALVRPISKLGRHIFLNHSFLLKQFDSQNKLIDEI